jgi:hypothetical protein
VELPPEPRSLDALGRNHSLETALADLIDNSVDAGATHVLIRFVQQRTGIVGLYLTDDGRGIPPDMIDAAMTVGGRRDYTSSDLGFFGLGLKAASFSQAGSLTLLSRSAGHPAVGRRWLLKQDRRGFSCDKVPTDFAVAELDRGWPISTQPCGTVVRWDRIRGFPAYDEPEQVEEFLSRTISHLQGHLGLMFHRILAGGQLRISIDVEDTDHDVGVPSHVSALDPFGYPTSHRGWPRHLVADVDGTVLTLRCHIWPSRSNLPEYRLPGGAEQRQGLYFYRRNRLLHAGGWEGIHAADKKLQLARVAIDIDGDISGLFVMNPEKSRVSAGPRFPQVIRTARAADGTTITDYLQAAEEAWVTTNQRTTAKRKPVSPPGRGLHPKVSREIRDELPQLSEKPLNILWKQLASDDLIEVDRAARTLWLNQAYRRALLEGRRGGLNDLPVLKSLLFLLVESVFQGSHMGARDRDNLELWTEILTAAAKAEKSNYEARA